ncbi:MAG: hypothetical protein JSS63_03525 [Bacteroidetes bacterium]|nr:hypothetical protein [Bacteroidota bacterium]
MNYIEPNLSHFKAYKDLKESKPTLGSEWWYEDKRIKFQDLSKFQFLFLLAEPGFGKSEFLNQIIKFKNDYKEKAIIIDLKKVTGGFSLAEYINRIMSRPEIKKTDDFQLINDASITICLDALDEVGKNKISTIIERIKELVTDFSSIKVIVSCRTLYFDAFQDEFRGYLFEFLRIEEFNNQQIYQYLKKLSFTEEQIDIIFHNFFQSGKSSVLHTPRYLVLLAAFLLDNGFTGLAHISRCDLFDLFIYNKLKKEKSILENIDINIFENILETLALTMEIYQTNNITREELTTFFAEIKNDLKLHIISDISIEEFLYKSVLKNNISEIEFENTEFQEYLSAKALSKLPKYKQVVFDLMVTEKTRDIYPSWFNVLNYLVELKPDLLEELLDFGFDNGKIINQGFLNLLTNINANTLSNEIKNRIFSEIVIYHQQNKMFMDYTLARNLSYYYTENNSALLKDLFNSDFENESESFALKRNIFNVIYQILERGSLSDSDKELWQENLILTLNSISENFYLKYQILILTKYFKSIEILALIQALSETADITDNEEYSLLEAAQRIDPDSDVTYKLMLHGISDEDSNTLYSFFETRSLAFLKRFFIDISGNENLMHDFHKICRSIHSENKLLEFIDFLKGTDDEELITIVKTFIISSYIYDRDISAYYSKVLPLLIDYISSIQDNFVFELIEAFKNSENIFISKLSSIFSNCVTLDNFERFDAEVKQYFPDYTFLVGATLYSLKYSKRKDAEKLFEMGRPLYPLLYAENDKYVQEEKDREEKENKKIYNQFSEFLKDSTDQNYSLNMFDLYSYQSKIIEKYITEDEKKRLMYFTEKFLSFFNPSTADFTIIKREPNSVQFNTHPYIQHYGPAIACADTLNMNVRNYRMNIINYIPFAYSGQLSSIFNLIKIISFDEAKEVINVYLERKNDLWKHNPEYFIRVIQHYNLSQFLPQLIEKFNSDENELEHYPYYKVEELNLISQFMNSEEFLQKIFDKYLLIPEKKFLANEANKLLIEKYSQFNAIKWRIESITEKAFEFKPPKGAHTVDKKEEELTNKRYAAPLIQVVREDCITLFLELYSKSFEIAKKGKNYESYVNYIHELVFAFFNNLKKYSNYEYYLLFESEVKKYDSEIFYQTNLYQLEKLKNQYLDYFGKGDNIQDCITKYNHLKAKQYIDVYDSKDLFLLIKNSIEKDLNIWLKGEGRKLIDAIKKKEEAKETELQMLIRLELERILLRTGIRPQEIYIYREVQSLDDKKPDFLIGYGLIKPVLVELKLSSHADLNVSEIENTKSYKSFITYRENFKVDYSIFLIYENQERELELYEKQLLNIKEVFEKESNVNIIAI